LLSGDGGGAGGDGDPIVSSTNSEKKSGYETNLYLYSVSSKKSGKSDYLLREVFVNALIYTAIDAHLSEKKRKLLILSKKE